MGQFFLSPQTVQSILESTEIKPQPLTSFSILVFFNPKSMRCLAEFLACETTVLNGKLDSWLLIYLVNTDGADPEPGTAVGILFASINAMSVNCPVSWVLLPPCPFYG